MPSSRPPQAIIVGGSLGGLFAATALRAVGWDVRVFERSPSDLDGRGGGAVLQPGVLKALHFGGIEHDGVMGVRSMRRIHVDLKDRVVHRRFSCQTQTSWSILYATLRQALPAARLHAGERLVGLEQSSDRVHARFESGLSAEADLLIGADGTRSSMRELLLPGQLPAYSGYVAWRGVIPETEMSTDAVRRLAESFAFQTGDEHAILVYMIPGPQGSIRPGERQWNWVWYRVTDEGPSLERTLTDRHGVRHAFSVSPGSAAPAAVVEMRDAAASVLSPSFRQLVSATTAPFVQSIQDFAAPRMAFGRALLLGDAAFVARPHTAGSTAKAADDAVALAQALRDFPGDLGRALLQWETSRLRSGRSMVRHGIELGRRLLGFTEDAARGIGDDLCLGQ